MLKERSSLANAIKTLGPQLEGLKETAEVVAADGGGDVDVSVLYRRMDECLEKEEYAAATLIKERIDALTAGRG